MERREYLVNIAREAVSYGFTPIPVIGKIPRFYNWQNVRIDPNDPEKVVRRVRDFKTKDPNVNIAIVTGEASGVVVIDVETPGIPWWDELVRINGGIPETFTVRTGTGGRHIYFRSSLSISGRPAWEALCYLTAWRNTRLYVSR